MTTALARLADIEDGIFKPVSPDLLRDLLDEYQEKREAIAAVAKIAAGRSFQEVIQYFAPSEVLKVQAEHLFDETRAVKELDADCWHRALKLTDVLDMMPQKRREAWWEQIEKKKAPPFEEETVVGTLAELLRMRPQFLAERVDGIFRALSGEHVTNSPTGFGRRMIINHALDSWHYVDHSRAGYINDLRCVIAKFMGRDEPRHSASYDIVRIAKESFGQWLSVDGGALRIRVYKKGTAHLEVHPEMVWRLNAVLAHLYPLAIASEHRTRPKKRAKEFDIIDNLIPFAVLDLISDLRTHHRGDHKVWPVYHSWSRADKRVVQLATAVIEAIGGARSGYAFEFGYDPTTVIDQVITSGAIPDAKSHQYYPTPEKLARIAVELADIGQHDKCLEPSAGQGGLADLMPESTLCVEISSLHCEILRAKGHAVEHASFPFWAERTKHSFDRVVMNPPFSEGRWEHHTTLAAGLLRGDGILVAILPASARSRFDLDGFDLEWHGPYENEFAGTSTSVVILKAVRR